MQLRAEQLPARLRVQRGSLVEISGDPRDGGQVILLYSGGHVRGQAQGDRPWLIRWLTADDAGSPTTYLQLRSRALNGAERTFARCYVELSAEAPFRLDLPHGAVHGDVHVALLAAGEKPARVRLRLDRTDEPISYDVAGGATIDTRALLLGAHTLRGEAELSDGTVCPIMPASFTVGPVAAVVPFETGQTVHLSPERREVTLRAHIEPDVQPRQVSWLVDGLSVATATEAPFDRAIWQAGQFRDGTHRLELEIIDAAGHRARSAPYIFTTKYSPPDPPPAPKTIPPATNRGSQPPDLPAGDPPNMRAERRAWTTAELRQQAARMAATGSPTRLTSPPGTVHGLAIEEITGRIGGQRFAYGFGRGITIEASITPGSGQVKLLNTAAPDTRAAVETAAAVAKRLVTARYPSTNWGSVDIVVSIDPTDRPHSGDSAGVATAVAIVSRCLMMPVDSSADITGAIGLEGDVRPVGAVIMKADYALATAKTLIVPLAENWRDILALYTVDPDLFGGHRLILARRIEEVLRQVVVGYDGSWQRAELRFQEALRLFGQGQDSNALHVIDDARSMAPENITMNSWRAVIERAVQGR